MLVFFFDWLSNFHSAFSVFQYLTVRGIFSALTAFSLVLLFGPLTIRVLVSFGAEQIIRADGPTTHLKKGKTPTMGGLLIISAVTLSTLLWTDLSQMKIWLAIGVLLSFGCLGLYDDWVKIKNKNANGMRARAKLFWQCLLALCFSASLFFIAKTDVELTFFMPFFKDFSLFLGAYFILISAFIVVGSSNALNLTDGLDGLAILEVVVIAAALCVFAYLSGHTVFAQYLAIPYIKNIGEMVIFGSAISGAGLGFLWFNAHPAQIFMGDVGSLALGAAIAFIAVVVRQEIPFMIMSGVLIAETLSVIIQILVYKRTGKRVFKMAPLHHHFEQIGLHENKVIVRFWIITLLLVLLSLATLKFR